MISLILDVLFVAFFVWIAACIAACILTIWVQDFLRSRRFRRAERAWRREYPGKDPEAFQRWISRRPRRV
jgi:hypothetical protein